MKTDVVFADKKVKEAFEKLKSTKTESTNLHKWLVRAFKDLEKDHAAGTQVQKKLIPKEYIRKYGIDNLWKYDLPNAWRLLYSIAEEEVVLISIVLEWLTHKDYEKRMGYR